MAFFSVHPAARISFLLIVLGGGIVCGLLATWIIPVVISLMHGGFDQVRTLGVVETIFPVTPTFLELTHRQSELFKLAYMVLGGTGFVVGCVFSSRYWRRLVVARGWMTEQEARAFVERNDDY